MNATLTTAEIIWVVVGFLGQALFSMRFIIQWFVSERAKKSIVPVAFWYFSVLGGVTLLSYAIYRSDPVFIAGQAGGAGHLRPQSLLHPQASRRRSRSSADRRLV